MRHSLGFGVLLSFLVAGFAGHFYSMEYRKGLDTVRRPAAISPLDLSLSPEQVFDSTSKKRILAGAKAWKENGSVAITLGHFLAKGVDGKITDLCDMYDGVTLTFLAEGMAVSGTRPSMTIESRCLVGDTSDLTQPIWIPIEQIKGEKPSDVELRFTSPSDVFIKLKNIPAEEWPSHWILTDIKMTNTKEGRSIFIDTPTIYKLASFPISISWL